MKVTFTAHAKRRMRERNLKQKQIRAFVQDPDGVEISSKNTKRFLVKKRYFNATFKKPRLLIAICEQEGNSIVVVTVIDTSKVEKYS